MAGSKQDAQESVVLNHVFGSTTFAKPAGTYIGLFSAAPTETTAGTELTGNGYARIQVTQGTGWTISGSSPTQAANTNIVQFAAVTTANWLPIVAFGVFSAVTGGTLLYYSTDITGGGVAAVGTVVSFAAGALVITED